MTTFLLIWISTTGIQTQVYQDLGQVCEAGQKNPKAVIRKLEPRPCRCSTQGLQSYDNLHLYPAPSPSCDCQSMIDVTPMRCKLSQPSPRWEIEPMEYAVQVGTMPIWVSPSERAPIFR